MWERYNQCIEAGCAAGGALNQGFPFSPLKMETYDGPAWRLMSTYCVRAQAPRYVLGPKYERQQ